MESVGHESARPRTTMFRLPARGESRRTGALADGQRTWRPLTRSGDRSLDEEGREQREQVARRKSSMRPCQGRSRQITNDRHAPRRLGCIECTDGSRHLHPDGDTRALAAAAARNDDGSPRAVAFGRISAGRTKALTGDDRSGNRPRHSRHKGFRGETLNARGDDHAGTTAAASVPNGTIPART